MNVISFCVWSSVQYHSLFIIFTMLFLFPRGFTLITSSLLRLLPQLLKGARLEKQCHQLFIQMCPICLTVTGNADFGGRLSLEFAANFDGNRGGCSSAGSAGLIPGRPGLSWTACRSVLEQDTEPTIAPDVQPPPCMQPLPSVCEWVNVTGTVKCYEYWRKR